MLSRVKEFLKDSSLYGLSQVLGQLIGFFLIPVYTKHLSPEDYAVITLLGFYTLFYKPIAQLGVSGAVFRFVGFSKDTADEERIIATAAKTILVSSLLIVALSFIFFDSLTSVILSSNNYQEVFLITILTSFFAVLYQFPFNVLRIKRQMMRIFWLNTFFLVTTIILTIYFVVVLQMKIPGVVYASFISTVVSFILSLFVTKIKLSTAFDRTYFKQMLTHGLPNVPHHLQTILMMMFAQYALSKLLTQADLGLYSIAWRFCLPFQLVVTTIHSSWSAYKFHIYKTEPAPQATLGFFCFVTGLGYIFIYFLTALFGGYLLEFMSDERFHEASAFLPYIALIPLFNGIYFIFSTGVTFGLKQNWAPLISLCGLIATISLSYILIPTLGVEGAGIATSLGWLVMAIVMYFYSQNLYQIEYSIYSMLIVLVLVIMFTGAFLIYEPNLLIRLCSVLIVFTITFVMLPANYKTKLRLFAAPFFRLKK